MLPEKSPLVSAGLLLASVLPTHAYMAPRTLHQSALHVSAISWSSHSRSIPGNLTPKAYDNNSSYLESASIATGLRSGTVANKSLVSQHPTSSRLFIDGHFNISCGSQSTTLSGYAFPDFSHYCVLWDSSCPGNRSLALSYFTSSLFDFTSVDHEVCFGNTFCQCMVDGVPAPAASISSYAEWLEWRRSPLCSLIPGSCCQNLGCAFEPTAVELYYWPDPDADTSCLSIIGDSIYPLDYGATTTTLTGLEALMADQDVLVQTYWGCAVTDMTTEIEFGHTSSYLVTQVITTAVMENIGGLTFKSSKYNPWETDQPCPKTLSELTRSASNKSHPSGSKIRARSLEPSILTNNRNETPISVATLAGHTL